MILAQHTLVREEEQADTDRHRVRVLIVHPDQLFRESLAVALAAQQDAMRVVGCISDAGQLHEIRPHAAMVPDVIMLGGQRGMRNVHRQMVRLRSHFKTAKVLLIGNQVVASKPQLLQVRHRTDLGPVSSDGNSFRRLLQCLHGLRGHRSRRHADPIAELFPRETAPYSEQRPNQDLIGLTQREEEILKLRRNGLSNKEVAVALHIGVQTVKNHVRNLSAKLRLYRPQAKVAAL